MLLLARRAPEWPAIGDKDFLATNSLTHKMKEEAARAAVGVNARLKDGMVGVVVNTLNILTFCACITVGRIVGEVER